MPARWVVSLAGNTRGTVNFVHCDGPCLAPWACHKGGERHRRSNTRRSHTGRHSTAAAAYSPHSSVATPQAGKHTSSEAGAHIRSPTLLTVILPACSCSKSCVACRLRCNPAAGAQSHVHAFLTRLYRARVLHCWRERHAAAACTAIMVRTLRGDRAQAEPRLEPQQPRSAWGALTCSCGRILQARRIRKRRRVRSLTGNAPLGRST